MIASQRQYQLWLQAMLDAEEVCCPLQFDGPHRVAVILLSDDQWACAGYAESITAADGRKVPLLPQGETYDGPRVRFEAARY